MGYFKRESPVPGLQGAVWVPEWGAVCGAWAAVLVESARRVGSRVGAAVTFVGGKGVVVGSARR